MFSTWPSYLACNLPLHSPPKSQPFLSYKGKVTLTVSRDRSHLLMKRLVKIYARFFNYTSLYCTMVAMNGRHLLTPCVVLIFLSLDSGLSALVAAIQATKKQSKNKSNTKSLVKYFVFQPKIYDCLHHQNVSVLFLWKNC